MIRAKVAYLKSRGIDAIPKQLFGEPHNALLAIITFEIHAETRASDTAELSNRDIDLMPILEDLYINSREYVRLIRNVGLNYG